ncbi:MarR family winged helix-turn-helix transcriptional regulator [Krasilnikovia sp. MM14-A1259]|uniref:MarR family winged helix-turn-helix transcriptional regulator n=1 Tax=Krasilnikovia sp. MM14-A1259 TaxID=3373539 RepID=UPI00381E987C
MPASTQLAADLRLVLGQLVRRVRADDPTPPDVTAVLGLLGRQGPMTTSELAAARRVRPQSMARSVGRLVEQGLAERVSHPVDRRKAPIALTARGHEILGEERGRRADWLARAIDETLSDRDVQTLTDAVDLCRRLLDWSPGA